MKKNVKFFLIASIYLFFFIWGFNTYGATIFSDDFNSYTVNNNLNGEEGWIASLNVKIEGINSKEGSGAVRMIDLFNNGENAMKSGTLRNDGKITIYLQRHIGGTTNPHFNISLKEGENEKIIVKTGGVDFRYWNSSSFINFGPDFTSDKWFALQVQWRSLDHKVRYNIDGGVWTEWVSALSDWSLGIDTINITGINGTTYFDTLQEDLFTPPKIPVLIIPGILGSTQKNGQWLIDPILHTYDNLIDGFKANGYMEDKNLFTLPYNWHQSNVDTAILLKEKISQIKNVCSCLKVDVIGHSMGGLVARQYIASNNYGNDIDRLVFLGTPHLGAPKDYLAWEGGVITTDNDIGSKVFKKVFQNEARQNGYSSIFEYIINKPIPSIQELLPIYNYLVDSSPLSLRHYPINYPQNSFLENLNNNLLVLTNSNIKTHNIIGDSHDNSTINFIRVVPSKKQPLWEHGYPEGFDENEGDRGLSLGPGDGTVPITSSSIFTDNISIDSNHVGLPTKAQLKIFNVLLGEGQHTIINDFHFPDLKLLVIKLFSPVDIQVIAPDGKRIGKNFYNNQEINEIPYAFYSGFQTNNEYITIINPKDGQYRIITQGTGNGGLYTVSSSFISDKQLLEQDFQGNITENQVENINLNLSSVDNAMVMVPEDITSPQITINSPQNQDYLHSDNFRIDYFVSDDESGIFSSSSKIDTIKVENEQDIDLFFYPLGNYIFEVQVKDNVNNQKSESIKFRVIATIDSTISDINRAYELGWIIKKSIKDDLIRRLNKATKLIRLVNNLEKKISDKPKILQKVEKIEKRLDIILGKLILLSLDHFKNNGAINQQAYDIIHEDINWIINN